MKDEINKYDLKAEEDETLLFKNVLLSIDYFGIIYKIYKETVKFLIEEMEEVSIFEDKEKFPISMKIAIAYSKNNIYFDKEEKLWEKEIFNKSFYLTNYPKYF